MKEEQLKDLLNSILNDAICRPQRIKHPNSNEITKFINEWMKKNKKIIDKVL